MLALCRADMETQCRCRLGMSQYDAISHRIERSDGDLIIVE